MSLVVIAVWLTALLWMLARAIRAIGAARAAPDQPIPRLHVVAWAGALVALGGAAVWAWSVSLAIRAATPRASARVELRGMRLALDGETTFGFSPSAQVELPSSWTLAERDTGGDLVKVRLDNGVTVASAVAAGSTTRLVLATGADATAALAAAQRVGCDAAGPDRIAADRHGAAAALACRGDRAIAALAFAPDGDGAIRVSAWIRRAGTLVPHRMEVAAGAAIELGAASGAVPGLPAWELPAPRGHADILVAPDAAAAGCAAWADASGATVAAGAHACRLALAGIYDLEVRARVPDTGALAARTGWVAAFLLGPPVLALLLLAAARRGVVDRGRASRLVAIGWLAVVAVAIAAVRLVWAHRIDVLRDLDPAGARTRLALTLVVATGALIAAACAWVLARGRRTLAGLAGLAGWGALGAVALGGPFAADRLSATTGHLLAIAAATVAVAVAGVLALRHPATRRVRPDAVLAASAVVAAVVAAAAPHLVAAKLALAWILPVATYDALRSGRVALALAAVVTALAALFHLDAGVTIAIAAPGVVAAAVVVTHDLLYHPRDARYLDRWERHQRPLTLGHAAILGGVALLALLALGLDVLTDGAALPARATAAALHLPAAIALALLGAAVLAHRRRLGAAAIVPAVFACLAAAVWLGRGAILDRAIASSDASGKRVAAVVAPGYALLRDERSLVAALTAWRETRVDGTPLRGDGYFAAEIDDPGVAVSIENDYLPVLVVREAGVAGAAATTALLLAAIAGAWSLGAAARRPGAAGTRRRAVVALAAGVVTVYQPLAAIGILPLTGVSWPGLGLDSPSDVLVHLALLAWLASARGTSADAHELAVRGSLRWRHTQRATATALGLAALAGTIVVARGAGFAAARPRQLPPAVDRAIAYADSLACATPAASTLDGIPRTLLGAPTDADTARFHAELATGWRRARADVVAAASAFAVAGACGSRGRAAAHLDGDRCDLAVDLGWPSVHIAVERRADRLSVRCRVERDDDALASLRPPPRADVPRVRVVGTASGAALADRAELVSDHLVLRLHPLADLVAPPDLSAVDAGLFSASTATLAPGVTITGTPLGARLRAPAAAARLLVAEPRPGGAPRWRRVAGGAPTRDGPLDAASGDLDVELTGVAVLVVDTGARRRAWLLRAAPPATPLAPLLADDLGDGVTARRHYVYAGALPELGAVDRAEPRHSLGLDGWIHAALAERTALGTPAAPATIDTCGTLAPPMPASPCAPSPVDGVLECRLAVDPLLEIELRHLTELLALDPTIASTPATRASVVVMRGDTGELLATADFVPGRASTVYAPGTPAVARTLARLREEPGESSAEKADLARPLAIGSTFKPFVARAAELTAPALTARAAVYLDPAAAKTCRRGRDVHDLLGHCPPRELLDRRHAGWVDFHDYLATSSNPFQALIGLLAPGWPDGRFRAAGVELAPDDILQYAPTGWTEPLEVERADRTVIGPRSVRLEPLRATPFWQHLEQLLGRPMCTLGTATACLAAADRRDTCAARALPIASPTADLRHLVALGPSTFDMYSGDTRATSVPIGEYFQLLRGSGVHPIGSLAQLTDAFNRLVFDSGDADAAAYRLAASWFPAPAVGRVPADACTARGGKAPHVLGDDGGLCGVVRDGGTAARAFSDLLADPRVVVYGAKTGTIDTLADVGERPRACEAWNRAHTLPDRPARAASQPYWLDCGAAAPDDSLFVVSLGIRTGDTIVPLTIGVALERTGKGVAAHAARRIVDALAAHLAPTATPSAP